MTSFLMNLVRRNPLVFNAATGGVLCASSDAVAQHLEGHSSAAQQFLKENDGDMSATCSHELWPYLIPSVLMIESPSRIDWGRVAMATCIGSFFGGILYPAAYARLDAIWVGTRWRVVLTKSIAEIATVGILVNTISLTARGFVRGDQNISQVIAHVSSQLGTVTQNDFLVWLPYNMMAFSMIPAVLRPTTTAAMEASWQTYISLCAHDYPTNIDPMIRSTTTGNKEDDD